MKIIELKVAISDRAGMNELVEAVCQMMDQDVEYIKDKFKMKTQADLKKVLDMCKFLKLKAIFDPTKKENIILVEVPKKKVKVAVNPTEEKKEDSPEKPEESTENFESVSTEESNTTTESTDDDDDGEFPF